MVIQPSPSSPLAGHSRTDDAAPHSSSQRPGVMARLHALFPTHADSTEGEASSRRSRPLPKFLKVRILTWNMHESLPKGDLEDLLGAVHEQDVQPITPGVIPDLPLNAEHPYHLIVVAGQECPSVSGIPMALGAGFKLKDKDKERDKSKESVDRPRSGHSQDPEKSKDDARDEDHRRSRHLSIRRHSHQRLSEDEDPLMPSASTSAHDLLNSHHPGYGYGWTSMLEDWFCNGGRTTAPVQSELLGSDAHSGNSDDVPMSPKAKSTGDLSSRMLSTQKGPYELLIKERMMGIYLAVFIKRDIRSLVHGMSKSAVTAGLIGGRVGNKGGVGISLNLNGTTLLFLNAHLAAHEGKMQHRLANLAKIKSELAVDTFLSHEDPRMMAEDITDRFDFAFICGDLNFRLDITRLHADWLISRREYAQALAFDQLRNVMQRGEAFVGFNEASIDFPPTFKYDVLRSRRSKHRSLKRSSKNPVLDAVQYEKFLTEIEESRRDAEDDKSDEELDFDGEATSVASTSYSRYTIEGDDHEKEREDYFLSGISPRTNISTSNLVNKDWYSAAAQKAKTKWISLLSTSVPHTPVRKWKFKHSQNQSSNPTDDPPPTPSLPDSPPPEFRAMTFPPTPDPSDSKELDSKYLAPSRSTGSSENGRHNASAPLPIGGRTNSTRSTGKGDEKEGDQQFNYDSSNKQRVPSWCDRILWKSTVSPELEPIEEDSEPPPSAVRNRMGSFLHVLRPASLRSRKDSNTSIETTPTSSYFPDDPGFPRAITHNPEEDQTKALERSPLTPHSRPLIHSKSIDSMPTTDRSFPNRSKSHAALRDELRSRKPSLSSLTHNRSPTLPTPRPREIHDMLAASSPKEMLPSPAPVTSLWRSLGFLPFLSRDAASQNIPSDRPPTPESPPPPPPQKGDVVCLSYDTLDDTAMRRLQAKSDHRPVIGSYAIYI